MDKKNIDWSNLGFGYVQTDKRFVSNFKDGKWDDGQLTDDARRFKTNSIFYSVEK